ncbi:MAG: hypothetical protein NT027_18700 [Proteobacteria bacterium]|nr:hypothetical protein [Pseudomonadota bacterium]
MCVRSLRFATFVFLFASCKFHIGAGSDSPEDIGGDVNSSYTYNFDENGCKTGEHEFSSKSSYCEGLLNESLNKGCAKSTRYQTYKSNCGEPPSGGDSTPTRDVTNSVDSTIKAILGRKLSGPAQQIQGEYRAVSLTLNKDGTYKMSIARGFSSTLKADSGMTIETSWSSNGSTIALTGAGTGIAGTVNGSPGVTLNIPESDLGFSGTFPLNTP